MTNHRVTQATLDSVAESITAALDNGNTYTAAQHFGMMWTLARNSRNPILHAKTKTGLHEQMCVYLSGIVEARPCPRD